MSGLTGQALGHYKLTEEIGRGGMATVVLAVDTFTQERVAIKVLSPTISGDSRFVRRFRRESSLLADLSHPNIVPVLDYGESRGLVYMVMPFVRGDTLQDRMDRDDIRPEERSRWIRQVADALEFAHRNGIIHRDVKPSNVMINEEGQALLTDFGLARMVEGRSTLTGSMLLGTPAYISPEQGKGEKVDARSDQYSFGVILYQLSCGRLPFQSEAPMGTVLMHIRDPVPRPSRFNPEISPAVERVILKAMAKDPEFRYPSVAALYQAFAAALEGAPLGDLDLPTEAIPLDPALRELREGYEAKAEPAPATPPKERTRLRMGRWVLLGVTLLVVAAVVIGAPRLLSLASDGASAGPTAVQPAVTSTDLPIVDAPTRAPTETDVASMAPLTSEACPGITVFPPRAEGNDVAWQIDNASSEPVEITELKLLHTPPGNQGFEEVLLGGQLIWAGGERFEAGSDRTIEAGMARQLTIRFAYSAAPTGYRLRLVFDEACMMEGEW